MPVLEFSAGFQDSVPLNAAVLRAASTRNTWSRIMSPLGGRDPGPETWEAHLLNELSLSSRTRNSGSDASSAFKNCTCSLRPLSLTNMAAFRRNMISPIIGTAFLLPVLPPPATGYFARTAFRRSRSTNCKTWLHSCQGAIVCAANRPGTRFAKGVP